MYLIDTNIFLEILLDGERTEDCKAFLNSNAGNINISDFSLHSIGVVLFRNQNESIFIKFFEDIFPNVDILTLAADSYAQLPSVKNNFGLDFDDAYQYKIAEEFGLKIITMDKDFKKIKDKVDVIFL
jgi:predicted nucleic acid-binding protein